MRTSDSLIKRQEQFVAAGVTGLPNWSHSSHQTAGLLIAQVLGVLQLQVGLLCAFGRYVRCRKVPSTAPLYPDSLSRLPCRHAAHAHACLVDNCVVQGAATFLQFGWQRRGGNDNRCQGSCNSCMYDIMMLRWVAAKDLWEDCLLVQASLRDLCRFEYKLDAFGWHLSALFS